MGLGRYPWTSTAQREHREGGRLEPALLLEPHQSSTKGEACEEKALGKAPGLVRHVGTMAAQQGLPPSLAQPTSGGSCGGRGPGGAEGKAPRVFLRPRSSLLAGTSARASAHSQPLPYVSGVTGRR